MSFRPLPSRREALVDCAFVFLILVSCGVLAGAAVLAHAPPVVVPFIVAIAVTCPLLAGLQLPVSIVVLRATRPRRRMRARRDLAEMRRFLRQLPETPHPFDR